VLPKRREPLDSSPDHDDFDCADPTEAASEQPVTIEAATRPQPHRIVFVGPRGRRPPVATNATICSLG
jgi:hypothetical protein